MKRLVNFILPEYFIITIFSIIASSLILKGFFFDLKLFLPIICMSFAMMGFNSLNNIFDVNVDKMTKPKRIIVQGALSIKKASIISLLLFIVAFLTSMMIGLNASIVISFILILALLYSVPPIRLRNYILSSNFIGCFTYGASPFILTWFAVGGDFSFTFLFLFSTLIFIMAPIKDIEDIKGESKIRISSFPTKFGIEKTVIIVIISFTALNFVMLFLEFFGLLDFIFIISTLLSFLLIGILYLFYKKNISRIKFETIETQSKIVTFTMFVVILIELSYGLVNSIFIF